MFNKSKESLLLAKVKRHLANNCEQQRLIALEQALTLDQQGLDLFTQQALQDNSEKIRQSAYWILHQHNPYLCKNSGEISSNKPIFPTDTIACVAISPDNQILVGGSWQKIWVWNLQTGELLCTIDAHSHWVLSVAINQDGNTLVSSSADTTIKIWDLSKGSLIREINAHSNWVNAAEITPDGKTIVSASADKTIKIWDLHTGQLLHPLKGCAESRLSYISIFPLQVQLECGQCQTFSIKGIDQNGLDISVQELSWQAEGGNIDNSGLFIAGEEEGEFTVTTTAGSFQTSASVTIIEPSKLTQLIITPQEIKLECGQVQALNIRGLDQRGSEIGVEKLLWQATGGTIDDHGTFHAGQNPGEFAITANLEAVKTSVSVTLIEPAKLKILILFPLKPTLTFGESLHFTIQGVDQYGSDIKLEEVTWSATSSTIFPDGRLQASYQEQEITVTANVGEISTSTIINVIEPARLTTLVISPQEVEMKPGKHQHFSIQGLDQRGNAIAISGLNWEATGGTIDHNAYYFTDSSQKGQFTITATIERFSVSAHVSVPPVLRRLEIFPSQIQLEPEENKTFTVIGFDQQDSQIALEKVDWKSTKGSSISRHGFFQGGYSQREVTVTASVGNVRKLAYVTLLPILRRLHISPPAVHLKPNESQTFTVIGFDQFGDEIDPGAILWEASGGDIDQNGNFIIDFNAKGQFLVTATSCLTPK
ncbi:MAG: WD40 repeat domain-containing protein [Nostoc sp.]|uniref:WD40 repeat domain-containing protein n=1 Tax=Nostoc sp. TaxID=1180 RepID=UPI002FF23A4A